MRSTTTLGLALAGLALAAASGAARAGEAPAAVPFKEIVLERLFERSSTIVLLEENGASTSLRAVHGGEVEPAVRRTATAAELGRAGDALAAAGLERLPQVLPGSAKPDFRLSVRTSRGTKEVRGSFDALGKHEARLRPLLRALDALWRRSLESSPPSISSWKERARNTEKRFARIDYRSGGARLELTQGYPDVLEATLTREGKPAIRSYATVAEVGRLERAFALARPSSLPHSLSGKDEARSTFKLLAVDEADIDHVHPVYMFHGDEKALGAHEERVRPLLKELEAVKARLLELESFRDRVLVLAPRDGAGAAPRSVPAGAKGPRPASKGLVDGVAPAAPPKGPPCQCE